MKAMILAAGLGTRLRPLTREVAKPAVPLLGQPLVVRLIRKLAREGVSDFRLNLHHAPESIKKLFRIPPWDSLPVTFSYEDEILGTAGGLKANESFFADGTFIMANADIVIDFSLQEALDFHRRNAALATMILYPQEYPYRYFQVRIDQQGRLRHFKGMCPGGDLRPEAYVFTGVHILEPEIFSYIAAGKFSEINDEVYPAALGKGEKICGIPVNGYWNDLGDPRRYLAAQKDLLIREAPKRHTWFAPDVRVADSARVGPFVSAGSGCAIGAKATVENAILWENVSVERGATVRNCIVGSGMTLTGDLCDKIITRDGEVSLV